MNLTKLAATAVIAGSLGLGGAGIAVAQPAMPLPLDPGNGHGHGHDYCPPKCGGPKFVNTNEHWDERWGAPPWGWGPPPPVYWNGGPRPQTIDYWGYQASPEWNDGFHQWGISLFGQWIPIVGVGFS